MQILSEVSTFLTALAGALTALATMISAMRRRDK